jgi:undecaprenyl-diphosphatase
MHPKRRQHTSPSWPEQQLIWVERERSFARWMHRAAARAWVVRLLHAVSRFGDGWLWYAVIASLPWAGGAVGPSVAVRMIAVGAVDLIVYKIIKRWIARPRPYRTCPGIRACAPSLDEFSFPSGHTLHSVAFSLILTVYYPALAIVVWPFTVLVAVSRIVLGLHYPSDVVVGAVIGALTAAISFNLL